MEDDIKLVKEGFAEFVSRTGITPEPKRKYRKTIKFFCIISAVAASLVLGVFYFKSQLHEEEWVQASTSYAQTQTVTLPDGSTAKLSPCSQIIYPKSFSNRTRRVMLVGEAFFDVTKDPKRQFTVSAGKMKIIVHGTLFNVSSYLSDEEDEVALVEGSVEMHLDSGQTSILLKPGEMIKYDKVNNITERRSFAANYFKEVVASDGLQFNNERLADIVATLNRRFNTNIVIENEKLNSIRYFASFINEESVDQILSALNLKDDFKITRKGNIIFIN
jgi:ferric-dicitrate binding protein FerR (iron transport regulator)